MSPLAGGRWGHQQKPWSPLSLPNLVDWYDASDAGSITSESGLVTQWNDLSGNARHMTASGTGRPTTGTRSRNSRNVIDFNGSTNKMLAIGPAIGVSDPWSVCAVVLPDTLPTAGNERRFVHCGTVDSGSDAAKVFTDTSSGLGVWGFGASGAFTQSSTANGPTMGNAYVVTVTFVNPSQSRMRINGNQIVYPGSGAGVGNGAHRGLGGTTLWFWDGWIGELFESKATWSSTDISNAETYMKARWGIT